MASLLAAVAVAWGVVFAPLQVLSCGYIPADDAKRHAAIVVSGKCWNDVLLLREGIALDSHPGWHALLGVVHRTTSWGTRSLVVFSVALLSVVFGVTGLAFVRRPESWALALLLLSTVFPAFAVRLMCGRPLLVAMAYVLVACFSWPALVRQAVSWWVLAGLASSAAVATYLHGSWYLLALPVAAYCAARQWRGALRLGLCTTVGVLVGATLTGAPAGFLAAGVAHAWRAFTSPVPREALVDEFRPLVGGWPIALGMLLVLGLRHLRGDSVTGVLRNPAALLAFMGYVLGFAVMRFWADWGAPAFAAWAALEVDRTLARTTATASVGRYLMMGLGAVALTASLGVDTNRRWSRPEVRWDIRPISSAYPDWLPDSGGVFYIHDMRFFYDSFYLFPRAAWKYSLGFEPAMMRQDDLRVYAAIKADCSYEAFTPWAHRMGPADRLVLTLHPRRLPPLPQLDWRWFSPDLCIGRLPRTVVSLPGRAE